MYDLDEIMQSVEELSNGANTVMEMSKSFDARLERLESKTNVMKMIPSDVAYPKTEEDLGDIFKLPARVKELRYFEGGNSVQYLAWIHEAENILMDYEIVKHKPIYKVILQQIRQKICGIADAILISYSIFDDSFEAIKFCLSLHYTSPFAPYQLTEHLPAPQRNMIYNYLYMMNNPVRITFNEFQNINYGNDDNAEESQISNLTNQNWSYNF